MGKSTPLYLLHASQDTLSVSVWRDGGLHSVECHPVLLKLRPYSAIQICLLLLLLLLLLLCYCYYYLVVNAIWHTLLGGAMINWVTFICTLFDACTFCIASAKIWNSVFLSCCPHVCCPVSLTLLSSLQDPLFQQTIYHLASCASDLTFADHCVLL